MEDKLRSGFISKTLQIFELEQEPYRCLKVQWGYGQWANGVKKSELVAVWSRRGNFIYTVEHLRTLEYDDTTMFYDVVTALRTPEEFATYCKNNSVTILEERKMHIPDILNTPQKHLFTPFQKIPIR